MVSLPWWLLLVCLVFSTLATYLLLEDTQAGDSPWALYPLTAVLAPVVLAVMVAMALGLSTFETLRAAGGPERRTPRRHWC